MPPGAAPGADEPVPRRDGKARWEIPFWALQVVELGVALLLVTQSVHVGHAGLLIALGAVLAALAVTADGPLGIDRICSQRLHCVLVVTVAVGSVVLAFLPAVGPDAEGVLMIVAAAAALVFLVTRTTASAIPVGRRRRARRSTTGPVIDATATVVPRDGTPDPEVPAADPGADTALRRAGRSAGSAAAAGRRAVDGHRPQVEDQFRRTLRGAGRLAGRLTQPRQPPDPPT
jgi:hypothetical protein